MNLPSILGSWIRCCMLFCGGQAGLGDTAADSSLRRGSLQLSLQRGESGDFVPLSRLSLRTRVVAVGVATTETPFFPFPFPLSFGPEGKVS